MFVSLENLYSIPLESVEYIKVFRPVFTGSTIAMNGSSGASFGGASSNGGLGAGGAIAVYTSSLRRRSPTGAAAFRTSYLFIRGYNRTLEFQPSSCKQTPTMDQSQSTPVTLYWNPMVLFSTGNDRFSFRFCRPPTARSLRVVVQGITETGKMIYMEQLVE